jgi:hypothetical protein
LHLTSLTGLSRKRLFLPSQRQFLRGLPPTLQPVIADTNSHAGAVNRAAWLSDADQAEMALMRLDPSWRQFIRSSNDRSSLPGELLGDGCRIITFRSSVPSYLFCQLLTALELIDKFLFLLIRRAFGLAFVTELLVHFK